MSAPASAYKDRQFLAVIGDEVHSHQQPPSSSANHCCQDSVTGLLLAGVGVRFAPPTLNPPAFTAANPSGPRDSHG